MTKKAESGKHVAIENGRPQEEGRKRGKKAPRTWKSPGLGGKKASRIFEIARKKE